MQTTIGGDEGLKENVVIEIASYTFSDGSKIVLIDDEREKNVKGIMKKYRSPRVTYHDEKGIDKKTSYEDFYKKARRLSEVIGNEKLFKIICKIYRVSDITNIGVESINKIVDSSDVKVGMEMEFLRKLMFGIHYGFYAEDNYLMYLNTKYRFGRDFNLAKYYLLLIGRLTPEAVAVIWNKDTTTVEDKHENIEKIMIEIRKLCPEEFPNISNEKTWNGGDKINDTTIPKTIPEDKRESLLEKINREKRIKTGKAKMTDFWQ